MNTINRTPPSRWRNLGIVAHVDAGKTTLTERLLHRTGAIHRVGEVHHGNATTDYSDIEKRRGITIGAAAVQVHWTPAGGESHRLTLIDTPGHIDFAIEVERSLRVLDGAVVVLSAVDGVQPQTETVWRQARRHGVPSLCFVNKMDRVGADFGRCVAELRERLEAVPLPLGVPVGAEDAFAGWIDLVARERVEWTADGAEVRRAWAADEVAMHEPARDALVAAVADLDDALAERFLAEQAVDADTLRAAIRRCTLAGRGVPVLAGAAFKFKGIELVLDAVVHYLPSPADRPVVVAHDGEATLELASEAAGPLAALVFKTTHLDQSTQAFVRVYSGTLRAGDTVWCSSQGHTRRIGRLAVVQADVFDAVELAQAGEIVAVLGWKDAVSGETLAARTRPLRLDAIQAQPAVLAVRLTPATSADQLRMGQGLAALAQEDPSFRVEADPDTGETLAWGMGELHLEVMVERLRNEWRVGVATGAPSVAYLETPAGSIDGVEGRIANQRGGPGQFAVVRIDLAPRADGESSFIDATTGGAVPKGYAQAAFKGMRDALAEGPQGYPVVGVDVVLVDGEIHAQDSNELAFQRAGAEAVRAALARVGTIRLEPVMRLVIESPPEHVGDLVGDLQRRQGRVLSIEDRGRRAEVTALAPLAKLAGYATDLRSLSHGRAVASQAFERHEPVRGN